MVWLLFLSFVLLGCRSGGASAARDMHSRFARYIYQRCGQRGLGRATLHFIRGPDMQAYAEGESSS